MIPSIAVEAQERERRIRRARIAAAARSTSALLARVYGALYSLKHIADNPFALAVDDITATRLGVMAERAIKSQRDDDLIEAAEAIEAAIGGAA